MNRREAITAHQIRLSRLTNTQVRNLMEHAANETPLLPLARMDKTYVDSKGRC